MRGQTSCFSCGWCLVQLCYLPLWMGCSCGGVEWNEIGCWWEVGRGAVDSWPVWSPKPAPKLVLAVLIKLIIYLFSSATHLTPGQLGLLDTNPPCPYLTTSLPLSLFLFITPWLGQQHLRLCTVVSSALLRHNTAAVCVCKCNMMMIMILFYNGIVTEAYFA